MTREDILVAVAIGMSVVIGINILALFMGVILHL